MIRNWLYKITAGRYGSDEFNRFLLVLMIIPLIASIFIRTKISIVFWGVAILILIYSYFRMFSKNIYKRRAENQRYLNIRNKFLCFVSNTKEKIRTRRYYKFFKCPSCRTLLRVPRGKGKIRITCRKCGHIFTSKT